MPIDVVMPQMGESIVEGTITRWLKQPGERVERDEPLFEITTDKVDAEIPSPAAGTLTAIRIEAGATVEINTVVAVIAADGEAAASSPQSSSKESAPPPVAGTDVVMPQMGDSIVEGTITRWLKQVGEQVERDEPLFEITTDKVDAEIPSPAAGILTQIRVPAGETVEINTVVAVIGGAVGAAGAAAVGTAATEETVATAAVEEFVAPVGSRLRSSPLVRRIAREHRVDLRRVRGTGSGGRITRDDILAYVAHPPAARPAAQAAPQVKPEDLIGTTQPLSRMRAIIAERMVESKRISPHVHSVYKVDMTRIAHLRAQERGRFEREHGVRLTYMPFIAMAATQTLRKFPILNSTLTDGMVHYQPHVDLGIAVALEWGLIVPVIRQAESRSFVDLARSVADLAARARGKKLQPDEAQGSTFTLTNAGVFGGEFGTPILNQPEAAILAIGGLRKEPVVVTDAEGNDSIAIRSMQTYCLGFDHRLIDGADAGKFMGEFQRTLENWDQPIG